MRAICVFCGSNMGGRDDYAGAATAFGRTLAEEGIRLVYGGANVGLMRLVANGALEAGGEVVGIIPEALKARELAHPGLTELHTVKSMHERKAMMADFSDGFVALPGGPGTMEEMFEIWTWAQLGYHRKPVGLLNVAGFFDPLLAFLDHQVAERFMRIEHRRMLVVSQSAAEIVAGFRAYEPPVVEKWIKAGER